MVRFEAGKTYRTRSICDHNTVFEYTIERRTAKNIWIDGKKVKVHEHDGREIAYPEGRYSMAPVIRAD